MKVSSKEIAQTGLLLAICIASQFMKNFSVYITGPIINAAIVLAVLLIGLRSGIILSIISPITAFLIAPSPIIMGIPLVMPCIMMGNSLLALGIWVFQKKVLEKKMGLHLRVALGMGVGAFAKAVFMGVSIVLVLLPLFSSHIQVPEQKLTILLQTARVTFSVTQLITALLGCVISYMIWLRMKSIGVHENEQQGKSV